MTIDRLKQRRFALVVIPALTTPDVIESVVPVLKLGLRVLMVSDAKHEKPARSRLEEMVPTHLRHRLVHQDSNEWTTYSRSGEPLVREQPHNLTWVVTRFARECGIDPKEILVAYRTGDFGGSRVDLDIKEATFVDDGNPVALLGAIAEHMEKGELDALPEGPHMDPAWVILREGYDPAHELEVESLLTVSNGYVGTRGTLFERGSPLGPGTLVAGLFERIKEDNPIPALVAAPEWVRVRISILPEESEEEREEETASSFENDILGGTYQQNHRVLDMGSAMLWRELKHQDPAGRVTSVRGFRLASQEDRHLFLQSFTLIPENYSGRLRVEAEADLYPSKHKSYLNPYPSRIAIVRARAGKGEPIIVNYSYAGGAQISVAQIGVLNVTGNRLMHPAVSRIENRVANHWEFEAELGKEYRLDRFVSIFTSRDSRKPAKQSRAHVTSMAERPMETHLRSHLDNWKSRWSVANIEIEGDPASERALRFASYSLLSAANPDDDRVSIGARALTGNSYFGHVFWDTEIFMLPFFICVAPDVARSLLMYRYHTLTGARKNARKNGYRGAMFAWESADTGEETTPRHMTSPSGEKIRILTGDQEHHITADVAYTAWQYYLYTGDRGFLAGPGAEILMETARFWASRVVRKKDDGKFHIEHAIGPDEYHEDIADNAFTNEMARWNLRQAATVARELTRSPETRAGVLELLDRLRVDEKELSSWTEIADDIVIAKERDGVTEQFRGYFGLEDQTVSLERQPGGADFRVFLDIETLGRTQLLKQADVVMLQYLMSDQFSMEQKRRSFEYYETRTLHGSSLSPAIYGLMAARLEKGESAFRYFKMAAEVDLENNMGNASGGLHSAAQGGLWQGAIMGFAGMQASLEGLSLSPKLPAHWRELRFQVHWRGQLLLIRASNQRLEMENSGWEPVLVGARGSGLRELAPGAARKWKPVSENHWQEVA
ncbi:MAG: hypothetical protein A2X94_01000 [Bdellovibrionales bacterium GWB1_55_8]|nr:MAG: hypothetical protein A2X94_01000 [Bdellovibrionales bacterium GWB1_55_8]